MVFFGNAHCRVLEKSVYCDSLRPMIFPRRAKTGIDGQLIYWEAFHQIGDPRNVILLCHLSDRPLRLSEMKKILETVPERTIIRLLNRLERNGFVAKKMFLEVPSHTEYSLTKMGQTLIPVLKQLWLWIENHWFFIAGSQIEDRYRKRPNDNPYLRQKLVKPYRLW